VDVKNQEGAALATHHLIDRGRKRIACISGPLNTIVGIDRQAGYLQALHEAGLPVETELMVESNFSEEDAYEKTKALLPYQPDAIFAASDAMALGALRALHAAGFRVPEDVAVVGFDDLPFSAHTTPTLTTIRQPILLTGKMAANTLIDLLEYPTAVSLNTILPVELVIRESSGK
jgi:LacI family transcriptional regulator